MSSPSILIYLGLFSQTELCTNHLPLNRPFRLVACFLKASSVQPLADGNLWQADILHDGSHNGEATRFGRKSYGMRNEINSSKEERKRPLVLLYNIKQRNVSILDTYQSRHASDS